MTRCRHCQEPMDGRLCPNRDDSLPCEPEEPSPEAMEVGQKLAARIEAVYDGMPDSQFVEEIIAHALDSFRADERVASDTLRLAMIGACATLDRAHAMLVPGAAKMRDMFRTILATPTGAKS